MCSGLAAGRGRGGRLAVKVVVAALLLERGLVSARRARAARRSSARRESAVRSIYIEILITLDW